MHPSQAALCHFCHTLPSRIGDAYCCDGCQTLAQYSAKHLQQSISEATELDHQLTSHFGQKNGPEIRFQCHVDSLTCEACLQSLSRLENLIPGLYDLRWDRGSSILSFGFPFTQARPAQLGTVLADMQLHPRWLKPGEVNDSKLQRQRTLRLGLTAAFAGNIMLFAVPIYTGVSGTLQNIFEWMQFILFLPIVFWSAQPIYKTAWVSYRLRTLSVDVPLALAFILGSAFSTASLLTGGHDLYFDSLSGFLLLILWSRSLLEGSLSRALKSPDLSHFFERPIFLIERTSGPFSGQSQIPWHDIREGDILILSANDRLPVNGVLLSDAAEIETAWMTGEKNPRLRLQGAELQAGVRILSPKIRVLAKSNAHETDFSRLLKSLQNKGDKLGDSPEARWGTLLVLATFAAIGILFLFSPQLGFAETLRRSIALLIVACPCAISFAAPLARALANQYAHKFGFWVRDQRVWDRLTKIQRIAFDKTGTLTGGLMTISLDSPIVDDHWKQIILSLENISRHPVAESLRRVWGAKQLLPVQEAKEILGKGVTGLIDGFFYEFIGSSDPQGRVQIDLIRNGNKVIEIFLQDETQSQIASLLKDLHKSYELSLISGDQKNRVESFGKSHGFKSEMVFGSLSPEGKRELIDKIRPDLYIGDGTNDLLALKNTPVSIAVKAAALEAQSAADLVMYNADLRSLKSLLTIAKQTQKLNRRNMIFALAYNLVAGGCALLGFIHPLAAALLMPLSSFILLASTKWGTSVLRHLEVTP